MRKKILIMYVLLCTTFLCLIGKTEAVHAVSITATSGIAIDYDTGHILYEKNADAMMVPASITKIMTAYIVYEELEKGSITLETQIPISQNVANISRNASYPMMVPLTSGSTVSVDELLKLIMIPSASASCIAMAEYISGSEWAFVQRMNETAQQLGMEANYENCHGASVHYVTARSQAILIREFITKFPDILRYTSMTGVSFTGTYYNNTNRFVNSSSYYGADGFKTGTISASGYCFSATAQRDGKRIISVVFNSSSNDTRFSDSQKILDYSFNLINQGSTIYKDIYAHPLKNFIEEFYNMGLSPYPSGGNFNTEKSVSPMEFNNILNNVLNLYNLEMSTPVEFYHDEILTKEKALYMIGNAVPFKAVNQISFPDTTSINQDYLPYISRVVNADVYHQSTESFFSPQSIFTRASVATIVVNLCRYIENYLDYLPTNSNNPIEFNKSLSVYVPFEFNTYNEPYSVFSKTGTHEPQTVELLNVLESGWWQVYFNDGLHWIHTQGKLTYADNTQYLYDSVDRKSIVDVMSPQILTILNTNKNATQIATWLGDGWISTNETDKFFRKDLYFTVPFEFSLYETPLDNSLEIGRYSSQKVQLLEIAENGFWYIKTDSFEGWLNTEGDILYIHEDVLAYDDRHNKENFTRISSQILHIEEIDGYFIKVQTWLGSKWIDLTPNENIDVQGTIKEINFENLPEEIMLDVQPLNQKTLGYPTGCETIALAMMISYEHDIDVHELARNVPKSMDLYQGFRGDFTTVNGFTIFPSSMIPLTCSYIPTAFDMSYSTVDDIKFQLGNGKPVTAWVKGLFDFNVHAICLTGYDKNGIYYNDPWTGSKNDFLTYDTFDNYFNEPIYDAIYNVYYPETKAISY